MENYKYNVGKTTWSTYEEEFTDNMKNLNEISSDMLLGPSWLTHPIQGVVPILILAVDVSVGQLITISLKVSVLG